MSLYPFTYIAADVCHHDQLKQCALGVTTALHIPQNDRLHKKWDACLVLESDTYTVVSKYTSIPYH